FVGTPFVRRLVADGWDVALLSRRAPAEPRADGVRAYPGELSDPAALLLGAAPPALAAPEPVVSGPEATQGVSRTVYHGNFGVVREQRRIPLRSGRNLVRYEGVARHIDPTSVSIRSLTAPGGVGVREQNYQFDLVSPDALLEKSVGRPVRYVALDAQGVRRVVVEGTLLSPPSSGGVVVRTADGRFVLNPYGMVEVGDVTSGLVSRPSLLWTLDVAQAGEHDAQVSYITGGITWKADYVAVVRDDEARVDLTGWVTLDNRSGATYRDARLQLMAGDVRRVQDVVALEVLASAADRGPPPPPPAPAFAQEAFFEYHLYTLDGATTVANNETKQMSLLSATDVGVARRLVFDVAAPWWASRARRPGDGTSTTGDKLGIVLELRNSRENRMGMPLPRGKVRVYKGDRTGNLQFIGEDLVDHTPRDETVRLYIGDAFDVVGERRVMDERAISNRERERTVQVTIRNHKDTAAQVAVVEHLQGAWEMVRSSQRHEKKDATTVEFPLNVPRDGEIVVTYTYRWRW
ncbi:MAG TPA: hypothetical protein VFQ76_08145, partial [Longimicrobiaceae bacterium]|nr:hypothetical protein [Longimicrobiaceae bacterium]